MDAPPLAPADHPRATLQRPLQRLEALGLARPPSLTVEQYLGLLVRHQLLADDAVGAYLALYQEIRYGDKQVDPQRLARVTEELMRQVRQLGTLARIELEPLLRELAPARAVAEPAPRVTAAVARAPLPGPDARDAPRATERTDTAGSATAAAGLTQQRGWRTSVRVVALMVGVLLVWSVAMVGVGYRLAPTIRALLQRRAVQPAKAPPREPPRQALARFRASAVRHGGLQRWHRYASYADHTKNYAEAIAAYHHIIARHPDNALALNNLAWLHLTAKASFARDRVAALALARRAHALHPAPYITDTLAEACYQNGQLQRAVDLERDAVKRSKSRKALFRQQLAKFSRALNSVKARPGR